MREIDQSGRIVRLSAEEVPAAKEKKKDENADAAVEEKEPNEIVAPAESQPAAAAAAGDAAERKRPRSEFEVADDVMQTFEPLVGAEQVRVLSAIIFLST